MPRKTRASDTDEPTVDSMVGDVVIFGVYPAIVVAVGEDEKLDLHVLRPRKAEYVEAALHDEDGAKGTWRYR